LIDWSSTETIDLYCIAILWRQFDMNAEVERVYMRALKGYEKAEAPEHTSTLDTINKLGNLYKAQGRRQEVEEMYERTVLGREKAWDRSTRLPVHNVGHLYSHQGRLREAEEMYHPDTMAMADSLRRLLETNIWRIRNFASNLFH
jgi:tetratricopeptide (TPR) repeat protein